MRKQLRDLLFWGGSDIVWQVDLIKGSASQAGQESFVLEATGLKHNGVFVEVGAWHGIKDSNTSLLERDYGWRGVAIELIPKFSRRYNRVRKSPCLLVDARTADFAQIFSKYSIPSRVDYLQLDIEPGMGTLSAMLQIPFQTHRFSVITFEHDLYRSPENKYVKTWSEHFLKDHGYVRVVSNCCINGKPFEGWWVDPGSVSQSFIEQNTAFNVEWWNLFE